MFNEDDVKNNRKIKLKTKKTDTHIHLKALGQNCVTKIRCKLIKEIHKILQIFTLFENFNNHKEFCDKLYQIYISKFNFSLNLEFLFSF